MASDGRVHAQGQSEGWLVRWDEQRRCVVQTSTGQCELRSDHIDRDEDHETGLPGGHGPAWQHDRCFHFAGGDGTRCVLIYGHEEEDHEIDPVVEVDYAALEAAQMGVEPGEDIHQRVAEELARTLDKRPRAQLVERPTRYERLVEDD